MKSSKITDVMFETKWNDFNIYKLKLANGQSGSILAKSYEPKVGEDLTYTYDVEKSRFRRVDADEFIVATLLPVANFKKGTAAQVHRDSRKML